MSFGSLEWAAVTPNTVIVASSDHAWIQARAVASPFSRPMRVRGTLSTTRSLLDAAVRAGAMSCGPAQTGVEAAEKRPALTLAGWAHRLCDMYQTTHATPPLMREAAARFEASGRASLARWAMAKAEEEAGHDELALLDLTALGHDARALVASIVPPVGAALVAYFTRAVRAEDPIGCVGYAYALERLALEVDGGEVARVEAILPKGVRATRCLRVHSASGSDRRHVREAVELIASLPPEERAAVARAAYETAAICARRHDEPLTDDALSERRRAPIPPETRRET